MNVRDAIARSKEFFGEVSISLHGSKPAFAGQFIAFATLVLPIIAGKSSWLPPLAFGSALATVLVPSITLAARTVFQVAPGAQVLANARTSLILITGSVAVPCFATVVFSMSDEVSLWVFCVAAINVGVPIYNMALGLAIRLNSVQALSKLRLLANLLVFTMTSASLLANLGPIALALSIGLGFGIPSLIMSLRFLRTIYLKSGDSTSAESLTRTKIFKDIAVLTLSGSVHQSYALVLPALGPYSTSWALVCRIVSGFETIGGVIVGPFLESRTLIAIRNTQARVFENAQKHRRAISRILGFLSTIATLSVLWLDSLVEAVQLPNMNLLLLAASAYSFCFAYIAVSGPLLYVLNFELKQLQSDAIKALPLALVAFAPGPETLLVAMAVSIVIATIVLSASHIRAGRTFFGSRERGLVKRLAFNLYNWIFLNRLVQNIMFSIDRTFSVRKPFDKASSPLHVLYSSAFSGNIGDQAMADSFVTNVQGAKLIITPYSPNLDQISYYLAHDAQVKVIQGLISFPSAKRLKAMRDLSKLIASSSSFSMIGADVLDGGYLVYESLSRMSMLKIANNLGVSTRVLGFSWRTDAPKTLVRVMRDIGKNTMFFLRDPASFKRLKHANVSGIINAADTAFSLSLRDLAPVDLKWLDMENPNFACLNISALISKRGGAKDGYLEIVEELHRQGLRVVYLPHVSTGTSNDDIEVCKYVFESFGKRGDVLVDAILSPKEVLALVEKSSVVVTGRMHLAILSMLAGVPAITFETQNKVKGLYELMNLESLVIDPFTEYQPLVKKQISYVLDSQEARRKIKSAMPLIKKLSAKNFKDY